MRTTTALLMLALVACGDSTSQGVDPIVQITNPSTSPVYFEWRDGQGVLGADTVPAGARACENFFARADSAYFQAQVTDPNPGGSPIVYTYTQPWFDPSERHAWTMDIEVGAASNRPMGIVVADAARAPC